VVLERLLEANAFAKNLLVLTIEVGSQFPKLGTSPYYCERRWNSSLRAKSPLSLPSGIEGCINGE
jgi:hypothetical protein